jgi:mono/diheme cytochrome c family protein
MDFICPWRFTTVLLSLSLFVASAQQNSDSPPTAPDAKAEKSAETKSAAAAGTATNDAGSATADPHKLFNDTVKPTFEQVCLDCHGGKRTRSGFDLSTREGLLKGGDNGIAINLQEAEGSRLIKMLRHTEDPGMPYKKPALDDAVIAKISKWIALGAPYDAPLKGAETTSSGSKEKETLWSVQPLTNSPVPKVDSKWVRSPIDSFIFAKLKEKNLTPSGEADRRTLIRRLTFDLHGLPPTPEEIDAFVNDRNPNAYEKLVDRLLASPRYGERWARHWLDVVHYADTHGYDKDKRREHAWPYRDYVIRSLNNDKAFGRFAAEQLAGDVLHPNDPDGIAATGFIVAGPWDLVGHTELKEGTMDKKITRTLDRDDMVANTMSTFCSLTVHCARCHNHKFDPISQKDYYSLQTVFAGIDRADRLYDPDKRMYQTRSALMKRQTDGEEELAAIETRRSETSSTRIRALNAKIAAIDEQFSTAGQLPGTSKGFRSKIAHSRYQSKWAQVDLGQAYTLDQIALLPVNWKHGDFSGPGYGFPVRFKIELSDDAEFKKSRTLVADETGADYPNPGDAPYLAKLDHVKGRYVRVTASRLWREDAKTNDWLFALSEIVAISDGLDVARNATASASDSHNATPAWSTKYLVDGSSSRAVLFEPSPTDGYQSEVVTNAYAEKWVQLDLGKTVPIDHVAVMPARARELPDESGYGFPVRFRIETSNDPRFKVSEMLADRTTYDVDNPGRSPMSFPTEPKSGRYVRITATQLWKEREKGTEKESDKDNDKEKEKGPEHYRLALSEIQVLSGAENVARGARVSASDSVEEGRWSAKYLTDGFTSLTTMADLSPSDGYSSETATNATTTKWVQFDLGESQPVDAVALTPARYVEDIGKFGYGFPVRFRIELCDDSSFEHASVIADETKEDFENPGSRTLTYSGQSKRARFVRVTATQLWKKDENQFLFALGELEIISGKANLARGAQITASDSVEKERWGKGFLADGYNGITHLHEPAHPEGYQSVASRSAGTAKWVQIDLGRTLPVDVVRLYPTVASPLPARFRVEASDDLNFQRGVNVVFDSKGSPELKGPDAFEIHCSATPARYVRITALRLPGGTKGEYRLRIAEAQVISEGRNVALGARVTALDSDESENWSGRFLVDGFTRDGAVGNSADVLNAFRDRDQSQQKRFQLAEERQREIRTLSDDKENRQFELARDRLQELDLRLANLPAQEPVYAAANDFPEEGTLSPVYQPRPVYLLARGDVNQPGDVMKPAGLSCIRTLTNEFAVPDSAPEGERRAALAHWVTDPKNAITWRSIVNRVWSYHFGRGIVDSPNDFGNMGSAPTHPELLDYLATQFLEHGQSLKWLHRQIVTSETYRQSCAYSEEAARIDSGNQFLWRMNRERLDSESLRDAILEVSGKLNLKMGGPGFDLFEFKDDFSPHYMYEKHQVNDPKSLRRSVYRFIVRSVPDPLMETLDCADPSQSVPVRNTTITALQALSLLNNPFVVSMSEAFADRLKKDHSASADQVDEAFRLAFGRNATEPERRSFGEYAGKYGLANACRLIFNSNEFIFVD